jgi:hypothetical protein
MAIERHVAHRRDSGRRGGRGTSDEAFPLGSARLVKVDMGVDNPGQDVQTSGVEHVVRSLTVTRLQDGLDSAVLDEQVGAPNGQLVDQQSA